MPPGVLETNYPDYFRGMGQIPESGYINQLGQILLPVANGLGFTVIPKSSLDAFPVSGSTSKRQPADTRGRRSIPDHQETPPTTKALPVDS